MTRLTRRLLAAAIVLVPACGGDESFSPTLETVAGSYEATTFTATESGNTVDLLLLGTTLSITLNENGTTSGRLFAPGLDEDGGDVDVDMAGTWTLQESTVTFNQLGDSFIPGFPFTADRNRLSAEGSSSGATIRVILTK